MTGDELRAAADRILENTTKAETQTGPEYRQDCDRKRWFLAEPYELATAYLAEHPADDGEPVTEEWSRALMLSIGAVERPKELPTDDYTLELELPNGHSLFFAQNRDGYENNTWLYGVEYLRSVGLPDQHTRGDVRRLLAALGVTA